MNCRMSRRILSVVLLIVVAVSGCGGNTIASPTPYPTAMPVSSLPTPKPTPPSASSTPTSMALEKIPFLEDELEYVAICNAVIWHYERATLSLAVSMAKADWTTLPNFDQATGTEMLQAIQSINLYSKMIDWEVSHPEYYQVVPQDLVQDLAQAQQHLKTGGYHLVGCMSWIIDSENPNVNTGPDQNFDKFCQANEELTLGTEYLQSAKSKLRANKNKWNQLIALLQQDVKAREQQGDAAGIARAWYFISGLYEAGGDLDQAQDYAERAWGFLQNMDTEHSLSILGYHNDARRLVSRLKEK